MSSASANHHLYAFGEFILDTDRGAVLRSGEEIRLRPKSFEVLKFLVLHHGRLVTKDELLDGVWGYRAVTEDSLSQCLIDIRKAIGDRRRRMIRTVPRRGYILDIPVTEHDGLPDEAGSASCPEATMRRPYSALTAGMGVLLAMSVIWWSAFDRNTGSGPTGTSTTTAAPNSIAVLPFVDMSPYGDHEYFADGISEEVLHLLAQVPDLRVIARTSSFSFKGQNVDIAAIAEKLNVAHVLEGSIRKAGNRVRVTAQLVDASGSDHIWSRTYDRDLDDILDVQSDIAAAVAGVMKVTLIDGEISGGGTATDSRAYQLYLQGRFFYNRRGTGDLELAEDYYRQALERDPGLALAWVGLAAVANVRMSEGQMAPEAGLAQMRQASEKALSLDPGLAEAHLRASRYYQLIGDIEAQERHFRRAVKLDSSSPLMLSVLAGRAGWDGRFEEAVQLQRRAVALDPRVSSYHWNLAGYLEAAGHFEDARIHTIKAMELTPSLLSEGETKLAFLLIHQGKYDEALDTFQQWPAGQDRGQGLAMAFHAVGRQADSDAAIRRLTEDYQAGTAVRLSQIYAFRGEIDDAFRWLAKARDEVSGEVWETPTWQWEVELQYSPFLAPLRGDPRWTERLAKGR